MIGLPILGREARRRATPLRGSSHIRGCHYTNCIVKERALHGAVALALICRAELGEYSVSSDADIIRHNTHVQSSCHFSFSTAVF